MGAMGKYERSSRSNVTLIGYNERNIMVKKAVLTADSRYQGAQYWRNRCLEQRERRFNERISGMQTIYSGIHLMNNENAWHEESRRDVSLLCRYHLGWAERRKDLSDGDRGKSDRR